MTWLVYFLPFSPFFFFFFFFLLFSPSLTVGCNCITNFARYYKGRRVNPRVFCFLDGVDGNGEHRRTREREYQCATWTRGVGARTGSEKRVKEGRGDGEEEIPAEFVTQHGGSSGKNLDITATWTHKPQHGILFQSREQFTMLHSCVSICMRIITRLLYASRWTLARECSNWGVRISYLSAGARTAAPVCACIPPKWSSSKIPTDADEGTLQSVAIYKVKL